MPLGLVINPGSTSTKVGVFRDNEPVFVETIRHSQAELANFASIDAQREFRLSTVQAVLASHGVGLKSIDGVIAIGGMLKPGEAGVYKVDETMVEDLTKGTYGDHAANLGGIIAWDLARILGVDAYVADPITADEMQEVARLSGHPLFRREGRAHTLNQKSVAMTAAKALGKDYAASRLVVAHLGGGISVVAHLGGRMVDTNNARGEGPFSIDRTGGLNAWELAKLCFSGKYSRDEVLSMLNGNGGVVAYLGTRSFQEVIARKNRGDEKAALVFDSLAYQVAKEIGAMATVLEGDVDAVVLTGGMANAAELVDAIRKRVAFIAPVFVYPGENELEALAEYLRAVLTGETPAKKYMNA